MEVTWGHTQKRFFSLPVSIAFEVTAGDKHILDVEEAGSWRVLRNQFTRTTNEGWIRVTISGGKLYASHLGGIIIELTRIQKAEYRYAYIR